MYVILLLWQAATLLGAVLATPTSPFDKTFRLPRSIHASESRAWRHKSVRELQAPQTSPNWAGAVLSAANPGLYTSVTGTIIVPSPSIPSGGSAPYSANIWVGIDGDSCSNTILQTGLFLTVTANGNVSYEAWYGFNVTQDFSGISFSPGDTVVLNVTATNTTWGTALIENKSNGQKVTKSLGSTSPLCFQDVEWIVQDFETNGEHASLANFGNLTFTDAQAGTASGQAVGTSDAAAVNMVDQQNNTAASASTNASTNSSSVTVVYVGASSSPSSASSHSKHTGAIVGGVVGGVVGLCAILFLVIMICRRRRRQSTSNTFQPDESTINPFVQTTNPTTQLVTRASSPAPSYRSAVHTNVVQDSSEADPERVVPVPVGGADDLSMRKGERHLVREGE